MNTHPGVESSLANAFNSVVQMMNELAIPCPKAPKLIWRISFALLVWLFSAVCFAWTAPLEIGRDVVDVVLRAGPIAATGLAYLIDSSHGITSSAYWASMVCLFVMSMVLLWIRTLKWFIPLAIVYTLLVATSFWGMYSFACYFQQHGDA